MSSKVVFDPEEPSLGRIRADSVAPPHCPASIKRCISRVEKNSALANADLFADISSDTPLKDGHISIRRTDHGPGLSSNHPMPIVLMPIVLTPIVLTPIVQHVESPSIPDGKYFIKNRAADIYWTVSSNSTRTLYFWHPKAVEETKAFNWAQVKKHSPIIQVFKE